MTGSHQLKLASAPSPRAACHWEFTTRVLFLLHGLKFQNTGPNKWQQVRALPCAYKVKPIVRALRDGDWEELMDNFSTLHQ